MLNVTNKMQRITVFFIVVKALHVLGGFSAHHQEFKNCTYSIWYLSSLVAATARVGELSQVDTNLTLLGSGHITCMKHTNCHVYS
jgi:hypothetical protein